MTGVQTCALPIYPTLGTLDLLDAIAAVVIGGASLMGGKGTILGTAAGVLLIVTIRNGLTLLGVNPSRVFLNNRDPGHLIG